jgi:hypothetical protein
VITDNDFADFALAADQQADLPVGIARQEGDLPGQLVGDDA